MPHNLKVNILPQDYVDNHVFDNIVKKLNHSELDLNIFKSGGLKHGITKLQRFKSCLITLVSKSIEAKKGFNFYKFMAKNEVDATVISELQDVIERNKVDIDSGDVDAHLEILRLLNNKEEFKDVTKEMLDQG